MLARGRTALTRRWWCWTAREAARGKRRRRQKKNHRPRRSAALAALAARTRGSMLFTFVPRTPALALMHGVGRLFPRGDRAPMIQPLAEERLRRAIGAEPALAAWRCGRTLRVSSGFYISQALELARS